MLTEFLRSFTLPGLEKKYIVADESLTEEGAAADSKKVGEELAKKVDKETGKALSTNDYTNAEKTKLEGIATGAQVNTIEGVKVDGTEVTPDAQKKVNLNVYDKAAIDAIVQEIYAEVAKKLNIDGYSELATVGNALGLVTDSVVEDKEPYNFRSLAHLSVGKFCYDTIVGGSVVWNQLLIDGNFDKNMWANVTRGTLTESGNVGTYTVNEVGVYDYSNAIAASINAVRGHKYFVAGSIKPAHSKTRFAFWINGYGDGSNQRTYLFAPTAGAWTRCEGLVSSNRVNGYLQISMDCVASNGYEVGDTDELKKFICTDLTAAIGSTIADYAYSLETTTAGAGVAWVRRYFTKEYFAYCEPHFEHVQVSAKNTVGFNALDIDTYLGTGFSLSGTKLTSTKTDTRFFQPTIQLYKNGSFVATIAINNYSSTGRFLCVFNTGNYDADFVLIKHNGSAMDINIARLPYSELLTNTDYCLSVTVEKNNPMAVGGLVLDEICINLHGDRDGEYEPYRKRTYPIEPKVLRGVLKLDASNRPYFDGDVMRHDGTISRWINTLSLNDKATQLQAYPGYETEWAYIVGFFPSDAIPKYQNTTPYWGVATNMECVQNISTAGKTGVLSTSPANGGRNIYLAYPSGITSLADFKTWLNTHTVDVEYIVATPTTETAEPFQYPMVVDPLGTEEFVDYAVEQGERDVKIPCGHTSEYPEDLVDKLEVLPHATGTNGDFLITELNGKLYLKPYAQTVGLTSVSETEAE